MGPYRQESGHREDQGPRGRGGRAGAAPATAGADVREGQPGHAGDRRRHRRAAGHAGTGRRRLPGLPRRARALDRRPHGPVRQDLPHPGLLGLHPYSQDVGGRPARQGHDVHLRRGGVRERLGGQLQGHHPPEGPHGQRPRLHGLRHLRGKVPAEGGRRRLRGGHDHAEGDLHALPSGGAEDSGVGHGQLHLLHPRQVPGLREGLPHQRHRLHPEGRDHRGRGGQHHHGHRLEAVRLQADPAIRLWAAGERLHEHGVRAALQRGRPDQRQDRASRRQERAEDAWPSSIASAAAIRRPTSTARTSAAWRR